MSQDTTIFTERLELRLLCEDDITAVFRYASDPEVAKNTAWQPHQSLDDTRAYVRFVLKAHSVARGKLRHGWAIRLRGEPDAIGTIDLVQDSRARAHIDFALANPFWNRGIVTEASRGVLAWGFERLSELEEIRSGCLSRNAGTLRVLEKLGFSLRSRTNVPRPPRFRDEALEASHFSLSREAFMDSTWASPPEHFQV